VWLLGVLPALLALEIGVMAALSSDFGGDLRRELLPESRLLLHGIDPFAVWDSPPGSYSFIWPVPAAFLAAPFTVLPAGAAVAVFSALEIGALVAALRILGVRDRRVYGVAFLWPATVSGFQSGNVTAFLALLLAVAWSCRERRFVPGIAIGLAVMLKIFLWPMAVWLAATRRWASAAVAAAGGTIVLLSVLPFAGLSEYVRVMAHLGNHFGPKGMGVLGLASQLGASLQVAQALGYAAGAAALALAWRRRSFAVAIAASLLLSPIVWLHYFVLLAVPIAIRSKTLSLLWGAPLLLWVCTESTRGGAAWQTAVALACLTGVVAAADAAGGVRRPRVRGLTVPSPSLTSR